MSSKPVAFLLADLGVTKTHSRPHVSDDNPYSESQFRTMKYRPEFPDRFGCIQDSRAFAQGFFRWYNEALCGKTLWPCRTGPAYCFAAVNWLLVPRNLSSILAVMTLPSAATVIRATLITFPSRLSVSSIVFLPMLFTETLVIPGSPL
jgi:transposase InsO family protein